MTFEKLWRLASERNSRLILAVDDERVLNNISTLLEQMLGHVVGIKLGFPAIFRLGPQKLNPLIQSWQNDYYFIADYKLADIPYITNRVLRMLSETGFNGATVHIFQRGIEDALSDNIPEVIGILSMSHRSPLLDKEYESNMRYLNRLGIKGVVVGASKKRFIRMAKRRGFVIFTPGVGVQGGRLGEALRVGGDFEIVGRSITQAPNPVDAARSLVEMQRRVLSRLAV